MQKNFSFNGRGQFHWRNPETPNSLHLTSKRMLEPIPLCPASVCGDAFSCGFSSLGKDAHTWWTAFWNRVTENFRLTLMFSSENCACVLNLGWGSTGAGCSGPQTATQEREVGLQPSRMFFLSNSPPGFSSGRTFASHRGGMSSLPMYIPLFLGI